MIELYSNNVNATSNTSIALENVSLLKGSSVVNSGTRTIQFNKCGIYQIDVNASANSTTATTGTVGIGMTFNGVVLPDASSTETVSDITATHSLSFSKLLTIPKTSNCCCSVPNVATIMNTGNDATFSNINVVVTKIC